MDAGEVLEHCCINQSVWQTESSLRVQWVTQEYNRPKVQRISIHFQSFWTLI